MKYLSLLVALLATCASTFSQRYEPLKERAFKGSIRFNMLGLIDPFDNNISVGGEYYFDPRWSVTADVGYVFLSEYLSLNKRTGGIIIKPGVRYYTTDTRKGFLELVGFYKGVGYRFEDWLGKDCVEGVPAYDEYQKFTFAKRVLGFNVQGGTAANISRDNAFRIEFWGGLGVRFKWQHVKNQPSACYQRDQFFRNNITKDYYATTSLPLGVRLVYRIE